MRFTGYMAAYTSIVQVFAADAATRQRLLKQMRILAKLQSNNNENRVCEEFEVETGHSLPVYVLVDCTEAALYNHGKHWEK